CYSETVHVLCVEDDRATARLLKKNLTGYGYSVDLAYDVVEGLAFCDARSYDVVTIDQVMSGMKGLEVVRALAARGPLPTIIIITGAGNEQIAVEAMKLGVDDYIIKDPDARYLDLIQPVIERAIERKRLHEEKVLTEKRLQDSEERLKYVLEGSRDGFWDWNLETGEVHRNERWAEMLGYSLEDLALTVSQWQNLVHPEDRDKAWQSIRDHLEGGTPKHECEYRMLTKDGEWKWILDRARVVKRDEHGKPTRMAGTHTDITDRKVAEEALFQSEERLQLALKGADIGLWDWDLRTGKAIRDDRTAAIYGYPPSEVDPSFEMWESLIHPADKPGVLAKFNKHLEGSTPFYDAEYRLITKSGETKWVLARGKVAERDREGKPLRVSGTLLAITDRKLAEEALRKAHDELELKVQERTLELKAMNEELLREIARRTAAEELLRKNEEQYRELVENSNDIVFRTDAMGFFTFVNGISCRITGYSEEELLRLHYMDLIVPEYRKDAEKFYGKQFVKRLPNTYYEFPFETKKGEVIWVGQNVQLITRGEEIVGFQAIARDITDLKKTEVKLR
ncbi:MAG: PAS domain-containing protein, partial [Deltaproteobacteria bacterium]|nr:PAS domain-containing protein [Deltaproteobacteria bacterium]